MNKVPRLLIAGTGGDCGKTLLSLSLAVYWRSHGLAVAAFKKGPDFIDAGWLKWASGNPARNLDTYLMNAETVRDSFFVNTQNADIAIIEGNRGLHDGFDARGSHSSALLAKILKAPVILLINAAKVTRTTAALALGCMKLDPEVNISGVVFNRVRGERHREILRESLESTCGIPALGFIPPLDDEISLPSRHLGLVTPEEHSDAEKLRNMLLSIARDHIDVEKIEEIANAAPPLQNAFGSFRGWEKVESKVKICYFKDSAFTFYYPENLEALQAAGAELIPVSSLSDPELPQTNGLYIGGGFPETHLRQITFNQSLLKSVKKAAEEGLPIYAECGGFIYLCRSLVWDNQEFELANVLPLKLKMFSRPQGHGYCRVKVDGPNPLFAPGTTLKGHEFHYSSVISGADKVKTVYSVERGAGCFDGRDGVIYNNVLAGYLHLHALSVPQWAVNFVETARIRRLSGG